MKDYASTTLNNINNNPGGIGGGAFV
jgi:hypothetical protein